MCCSHFRHQTHYISMITCVVLYAIVYARFTYNIANYNYPKFSTVPSLVTSRNGRITAWGSTVHVYIAIIAIPGVGNDDTLGSDEGADDKEVSDSI